LLDKNNPSSENTPKEDEEEAPP